MSLAKNPQPGPAPTPVAAGSSLAGLAQACGYGASGVARIANGSSPPATPCAFFLDFSADGSAWVAGPAVGLGDTAADSLTLIPFAIGIGSGADWAYYRVRFAGHTGQGVTVACDASATTGV
ncbi:MAG: hypothetical protein U0800_26045 [Isosphaeraceae bacterium]